MNGTVEISEFISSLDEADSSHLRQKRIHFRLSLPSGGLISTIHRNVAKVRIKQTKSLPECNSAFDICVI